MTDFIHYPPRRAKIVITEDTKTVVEQVIAPVEELEEKTEEEVIETINESKKFVAKKTKEGVKVKRALKG